MATPDSPACSFQVESYFGSDAPKIMEVLDKAICLYIKHSDDLHMVDAPKSLMNYSLEDYKYLRLWTGGAVPLAGCFWFGVDIPKVRCVCAVLSSPALLPETEKHA